ncbi:MAG TPA: type II toxin-antitoxin system VapC family toxin [Propylenella sp.]
MFLDASAIVSIVALEPGHEELARRLDEAPRPLTSALAVFEAALAIGRDNRIGLQRARTLVERFVQTTETEIRPIDSATGDLALDAHDRFGKGRHPARLNFGDCFAYAMAQQHGVPLLYKGDDFALTDLA